MAIEFNFKFDQRGLEKELEQATEKAMRDLARQFTRDYAAMSRRLKGKPLNEIRAELVRYHEDQGGEVTEPELTEYAELLQAGDTITFKY